MIREYLGEAGFHVAHAANGTDGLARQEREPFDVLILDLMLPDMDGLDICTAGSGLGLSLVQQIARRHGGEVVYRAAADGNCFVVTLPTQPRTA